MCAPHLSAVCAGGDSADVKRLVGLLDNVRAQMLLIACLGDHLATAKTLKREMSLDISTTRQIVDPKMGASFLQIVCWAGSPEIIRWVIEAFDLTKDDMEFGGFEALEYACAGNTRRVVVWLLDRFAIPKSHAGIFGLLAVASRYTNESVAEMLKGYVRCETTARDVAELRFFSKVGFSADAECPLVPSRVSVCNKLFESL